MLTFQTIAVIARRERVLFSTLFFKFCCVPREHRTTLLVRQDSDEEKAEDATSEAEDALAAGTMGERS